MNSAINCNQHKIPCETCSYVQICLPLGAYKEELDLLNMPTLQDKTIEKNESLFHNGQPFKYLFVVRTGSFKTAMLTNDGEEHVIGFHMPGDLLGFDALSRNVHSCTAVALETSRVCMLPYKQICELCQKAPELSKYFMELMSHTITDKHETMQMLGKKTAELKVAALLLNFSSRFHGRGFSDQSFNLSMSRQDIGSHLGLAVETVSRLLRNMQDNGIIEVDRRYIKIEDMAHLQDLVQN